jgi:chemotaxis protein methyltransferase CheR
MEPLRAWQKAVLPQLVGRANRIRIWSAGCSTGEEPYSAAMLLSGPALASADTSFEVIGTDISKRAIELSRAGLFDPHSLRHMDGSWREAYLQPLGSNGTRALARWRISEKLQRLVKFQQANLLDKTISTLIGPVDLVLCRNVMIYFGEATRQTLLNNLYDTLRPGGHLILGHSESLAHVASPFELVHVNGVIMYRKS